VGLAAAAAAAAAANSPLRGAKTPPRSTLRDDARRNMMVHVLGSSTCVVGGYLDKQGLNVATTKEAS